MSPRIKKFFSGRNIYCIVSLSVLAALITAGSVLLGPKIVSAVKNPEELQTLLGSDRSIKSYLIFIGIQFIQIIFAFIPGEFIEFGAGYIYGGIRGLIMCSIGALGASALIFGLTRLLGHKFTKIMIDSRDYKRLRFLNDEKKVELMFALLYFIPGTPKDLITYFAGATKIRFHTFLIICTFCRIPSIITSTLAGEAAGSRDYLQAAIIYGVTAVVGIGGYLFYGRFTKRRRNKRNGAEKSKSKPPLTK